MTTTIRRPRKKKGAAAIAETSAEPLGEATSTLAEPPTDPVATTNTDVSLMECLPSAPVVEQQPVEQPPFEPTGTYTPVAGEADRGAANEAVAPPATTEPRLRTWVVDESRGYCRMTDEDYHRLVVQFSAKPPEDLLTAVKGAGFRFQSDYRGQKNAWVRRNDFEGRLQIEAIEKLIHELIPGPSSPAR
jgi:hypothetical protein